MVERSDAFVLFGATGDLAFKKLFPALYELARAGRLPSQVIGVARTEWDHALLAERARKSIEASGPAPDPTALKQLMSV